MKENHQKDFIPLTHQELENLSFKDVLDYKKKYQAHYFPKSRQYAFIAYNIIFAMGGFYMMKRSSKFGFNLFQPKHYGYSEIFKYGTVWSVFLASVYCLGTLVVTGVYNPVQYIKELASIEGKIVEDEIRHDERLLFDMLNFFKIDDKLQQEIRLQLEKNKKEYLDKNPDRIHVYLGISEDDDDEDDEDLED